MIQKRAGWLTALFLGEMLTATAMGFFEDEISKAVVLALFIPLIISSGGNSGSQAVDAGHPRAGARRGDAARLVAGDAPRDSARAWRSARSSATIGFLRITRVVGLLRRSTARTGCWSPSRWRSRWSASCCGARWSGSLLPFVLRRLGFDPATSSAPFVATLVDVTGLVIYFTVALVVLRGTLL